MSLVNFSIIVNTYVPPYLTVLKATLNLIKNLLGLINSIVCKTYKFLIEYILLYAYLSETLQYRLFQNFACTRTKACIRTCMCVELHVLQTLHVVSNRQEDKQCVHTFNKIIRKSISTYTFSLRFSSHVVINTDQHVLLANPDPSVFRLNCVVFTSFSIKL